ncbi:uncharacterized protein TRUGW13939_03228 [Talaromyces rugulosus]|uniref:GPI anchored serine-threonine rich protein n=1 Tax=Talaromyces rugulosus TaxID=121627 RepID=A0A7H8QQH2_TALRU|nr:uncharacterized protein TRUGW13939_03228 [Talaromyces rugulosus]QKX56128.1 hypothetical protein TRUGW13939_03228 [Talaromyces rugulosus]
MRFATTIASLLTVGMAAALSRRACAAQNILDACLASMTPQLEACEANDWSCLCNQSTNVLTCYNNCPGDDNQFGAQQTKTSYCNAAKAYATTTTTTSSSHSATATSSEASAASASETSSGSSSSSSSSLSSTSTGSFAQSTSSGAAAAAMATGGVHVHVQGGLVAALALGLGAVL